VRDISGIDTLTPLSGALSVVITLSPVDGVVHIR
jgi:hypothetical protein